jgi:eukaryotic-like serine/threonine-protein kinase
MGKPTEIGPYLVERLLGTGSFATVWLAYDPSLDARVAVKVLAENWNHDLRVRERFLDEARLLRRLDHERVVRVHAFGELPDGRPYIVMAWADGGSLRGRLAAGPMRAAARLWVLREAAAAVAVLHTQGVVHRDLAPGNVLFRSVPGGADRVLIADLGLAKALAAASGLTARAGTPGYMAPEQDDPFAVVDTRTDVYGLGRLGIELLTVPSNRAAGGRPSRARPSDGRPLLLRPGVPAKVVEVLGTACAFRPADRYRDATAFGAALDRATEARGPWAARGHRGALAAGLVLSAAAATALAADSVGPERITVTLPAGWRTQGREWDVRTDGGNEREPALLGSPAPDRWYSDPTVPGIFIGLSRSIAARTTPAGFLAERSRQTCVAAPPRITRRAGIDWVVIRYTSCPGGKPVIVEMAGLGPGDAGLVYVQLAPPPGSGPEFVDVLLDGIRVH